MKRFKEKIKAIWHIITDSEYIIFTATIKNNKLQSGCALISDNVSNITIDCSIETLIKNL